MRTVRIFFFLSILFLVGVYKSEAQTTRDTKVPAVPAPQYQVKKTKKQSFFNKLFSNSEVDEEKEFQQRMKKVGRQKRKEERLALKPQYSDPTYFGHKKPPKKRPLGKRKYCEECGLRH